MNLTRLIPFFVLVATNCHSAIAKDGQARRLVQEWEKGTNPSKGSKGTNPSKGKATNPSKGKAPTVTTSAPVAPTMAPVASCTDDDDFEFVTTNTGVTVKCDWLTKNNPGIRIPKYCKDGPVLDNCLASCDNCSCAADSDTFEFTVVYSSATVGCDWFGKRNTERRRANYCVESGRFYDKTIADMCVSGCFCTKPCDVSTFDELRGAIIPLMVTLKSALEQFFLPNRLS